MKLKAYLRLTKAHEIIAAIKNGKEIEGFYFYDNAVVSINIGETTPLKWGSYPTLIKKIKEIYGNNVEFLKVYRK